MLEIEHTIMEIILYQPCDIFIMEWRSSEASRKIGRTQSVIAQYCTIVQIKVIIPVVCAVCTVRYVHHVNRLKVNVLTLEKIEQS